MQFQELSDKQWNMIQEHLPKPASTGRPRAEDRTTINRNIRGMISHRTNSKTILQNNEQNNYNKTRYVVERFFAWLKCGFRRMVIRYERRAENYESLINIASFLMYCRVLG